MKKTLFPSLLLLLMSTVGWGQSLVKNSNVTGPVTPGQTYTVTLNVCLPAPGPFVVTDVLPTGLSTNTGLTTVTFSGTLTAAGCTTKTYTVVVPNPSTYCTFANNTTSPLTMVTGTTNVTNISCNTVISAAAATGAIILPNNTLSSSLGSVVTGKTYLIDGKFNVNKSIKFINCNIIMLSGAKMEVQLGQYLSMDQTFVRGCGTMWDAIYALGKSSAVYLTNSRIEDARAALWMTNGSNLSAANTLFRNNFVSIYVPPINITNQAWQTVAGTINKSTFSGGLLLPRFVNCGNLYHDAGGTSPGSITVGDQSFAGVVAMHCSSINWFSSNGNTPVYANTSLFDNLHIGINISLAADVSNARFTNIRDVFPYGTGGAGAKSAAIYAMINQSIPPIPPLLTVRGFGGVSSSTSMFSNCDIGIYANFHAFNVTNVKMLNIKNYGVFLECTSPSIQLSPQPQALIANNYIEIVSTSGNSTGIGLSTNTNIQSDIKYNTLYMKYSPSAPLHTSVGILHAGCGNPQSSLLIRHNNIYFSAGGNGVYLDQITGASATIAGIKGATARVAWNLIDFNTEEDFKGILVYGVVPSNPALSNPINNNIDIQHNTITGRVTALPGTGIDITYSTFINVTCNTLSRSQVGIQVRSICNPTSIEGNDFGNHASAIRFSANGVAGPQAHRRNRWNGTTTMSIEHVPATTSIIFSQFTVSSALSGTSFMPAAGSWSTFAPPAGAGSPIPALLTSTANPILINCNSQATGVGLRPLAITALDQAVATGQYEAPEYTEETLWQMQQDLYQWLIANDTVWAGDSLITAFVDSVESTPLGELLQPADSPVSFISPTVVAQLEALIPLIQAKEYEIFHADSLIAETPEDTLLLQNRVVLGEEYGQLLHFADSLGQIINEGSTRDADSLRARNDRVLATEVYEQNQQTVNSMYLATYGQGISVLTPDQQTALLAIAGQCPMAGGRAVLHARGMLRYGGYDVPAYNDESLCLTQGMIWRPGKPLPEALEGSVLVAPNPANDVLTLSNTTDEDAEFVLYDMTGKVIATQVVLAAETRTLPLLTFAPGVYSYAIHGSAIPQVGKLVIVR